MFRISVLAIASLAALALPSARAVDVQRSEALNPLNACQGALPAFEGGLRKRPRGFVNEGAGIAFLSCAWPAEAGADKTTAVYVEFRNEGTTTQEVTCTAVDSRIPPRYSTKTVSVTNAGVNAIGWNAADNGGSAYRYPSVSCGLPTGMLIQFVVRTYSENIGN